MPDPELLPCPNPACLNSAPAHMKLANEQIKCAGCEMTGPLPPEEGGVPFPVYKAEVVRLWNALPRHDTAAVEPRAAFPADLCNAMVEVKPLVEASDSVSLAPHPQVLLGNGMEVDAGIAELVEALCVVPGLETFESCQGGAFTCLSVSFKSTSKLDGGLYRLIESLDRVFNSRDCDYQLSHVRSSGADVPYGLLQSDPVEARRLAEAIQSMSTSDSVSPDCRNCNESWGPQPPVDGKCIECGKPQVAIL